MADMSQPKTVETSLAEFVTGMTFEDLSDEVVETVRRAFVDTVGVTLAGLAAESGDVMDAYLEQDGLPTDGLLGTEHLPVTSTALAVGTASHALDYDDLSWGIDGHPSIVLVPPILAVADRRSVTGEQAVTAYAVGYDVACAVAEPISPGHYADGWHATATFGTFGATAAVASLLDLDREEVETALNIAASMPAGAKRNFGSMTKPLHAGLASRSGITAAFLAAEGFTSGANAVSGARGFWDLYGDAGDERPVIDVNTRYLEEHGVHVKRYPCCYFTHSTIAAVQDLVVERGLDHSDVVHVDVYAAGGAIDALSYTRPATELEAKFSMQHAVAVALTCDRVGLEMFEDETLADDTVRDLYERVELHENESLSYDSHGTRVEIDLSDRTVGTTREHPPWTHEHPPSTDDLRAKFFECATRAVDAERAERLYDRVSTLPASSVTNLLRDTDG